MVYCLVLGKHPREAFEVENDEFSSILKLKDIIWEKNKDIAPSARKLRLWQVDISNEENEETEKLKILIDTPPHEINIENQLEGKELFTNKDLGEYFPDPVLDRHIRIIVEPPSSPATTGKCLPMVYLSNKKFALSHIFYSIREKKTRRLGLR